MKENSALLNEVKSLIIDSVGLHHINPADMHLGTTLYQDGLGLDSVDILELVVAVEQQYGVKIKNSEEGKQIFESVGALVEFISSHKQ